MTAGADVRSWLYGSFFVCILYYDCNSKSEINKHTVFSLQCYRVPKLYLFFKLFNVISQYLWHNYVTTGVSTFIYDKNYRKLHLSQCGKPTGLSSFIRQPCKCRDFSIKSADADFWFCGFPREATSFTVLAQWV